MCVLRAIFLVIIPAVSDGESIFLSAAAYSHNTRINVHVAFQEAPHKKANGNFFILFTFVFLFMLMPSARAV